MASAESVCLGVGGRTAGCALGSVGLFHMGSLECATAPGDTCGHAVGSDRFVAGRWWSAGDVVDGASDHQMDGCVVVPRVVGSVV